MTGVSAIWGCSENQIRLRVDRALGNPPRERGEGREEGVSMK